MADNVFSLARIYEVKECLCDTSDARPRALARARARDQNVQLLRMAVFSVTTRDRDFILGICLHLEKTNRTSEPHLMLSLIV